MSLYLFFIFLLFYNCPHLYICIVCMYIWLNCIYLNLNVYCQCLMLTVCTKGLRDSNFNSLYVCTVHVEELTIKLYLTWLDLITSTAWSIHVKKGDTGNGSAALPSDLWVMCILIATKLKQSGQSLFSYSCHSLCTKTCCLQPQMRLQE